MVVDADVKIEDGITWVRLEAHGFKVWANLEELNRDPLELLGPITFDRDREPIRSEFFGGTLKAHDFRPLPFSA